MSIATRILSTVAMAALSAAIACMPSLGMAVERDVVVARDVTLHVADEGPRDGKPVLVLIPGWRFTIEAWSAQIAAFSTSRRVVAFDPRSQGRSTIVAGGNTPEQRARDLDALLRQLGVDDAVLVGWSQGVQDLAAYVEQFGTRAVRGLVFVDAPVSAGSSRVRTAPDAAAVELGFLRMYADAPDEFTRGMLDAIVKHPSSRAQLDTLHAQAMRTPVDTGVAMWMADLYGTDRRGALAKIDKPLLVIAAGDSRELDAQRATADRVPGARFERIDDAGHAVFIDQPVRFDEVLRAFIDGL